MQLFSGTKAYVHIHRKLVKLMSNSVFNYSTAKMSIYSLEEDKLCCLTLSELNCSKAFYLRLNCATTGSSSQWNPSIQEQLFAIFGEQFHLLSLVYSRL